MFVLVAVIVVESNRAIFRVDLVFYVVFQCILENNSILNIKCLNHTVSPNSPTLHPFQRKTTLCSLNYTSWTTTLLSCSTSASTSDSRGSAEHMLSQLEPLSGILGFRENISCSWLKLKYETQELSDAMSISIQKKNIYSRRKKS